MLEHGVTNSRIECAVGPGSSVTLRGQLELGGVGARIITRNNQRGTHERTDDLVASMVLVPPGTNIEIPDTAMTASANAPIIYVQLFDAAGTPLTGEVSLSACGAGALSTSTSIALPSIVTLGVDVGDCSNSEGPEIALGGSIELTGLTARLIARDPATGALDGFVAVSAPIVALGSASIRIPNSRLAAVSAAIRGSGCSSSTRTGRR